MLELRNLNVSYGKHAALQDVAMSMTPSEVVVVLGANGAGKSTLIKSVAGLVTPQPGAVITMEGRDLTPIPPHQVVETGIAVVPEGRGIFGELTVAENLLLGANPRRARADQARSRDLVLDLFPRLAERQRQAVRTMSGGEQQMVAIGRALMSQPRLLMLDEPSLGLAPVLVGELFAALARIRDAGVALLIVEQNVRVSLSIADRGYLLEAGRIVGQGPADRLANDPQVRSAFLGADV